MKKAAALILAAFFAFLFQLGMGLGAQNGDAAKMRQLREGERVFRLNCQACHGKEGDHPDKTFNLVDDDWKHGDRLEDIKKTITEGAKGTAMVGFQGRLTPRQIDSVAQYVFNFRNKKK